ncbi:SEC-C metal-binding domain-containing protein [Sporosarcina limicola]|uniref:Metal-binding protein n=1 Tax=Sporosarcina limicola TaxID=34101 RepID=A0A927R680_9BACL|nr:hypothetical protein [Sporosarcina limicola]
MVGRNDHCPCGSGKKYKKCCESKEVVLVKDVHLEELERILQTFYEEFPRRKDIPEFLELLSKWESALQEHLSKEMIAAIVLDEFFFLFRTDLWTGYLEKQQKKQLRPSVVNILETWQKPRIFIGEVLEVEASYMVVKMVLGNEIIQLKRESEKPVSVGAFLYCFILPDGNSMKNHYLAVSSLIFFPVDHDVVFKNIAKQYEMEQEQSVAVFWKENSITFWERLGEDGYDGGEFTEFETGVLINVMEFLEKYERESDKLLEFVEDYLVEIQPNARKEVAIAAGAIRFGMENAYFEPLQLSLKDIAEWFGVSPPSMNKYYKELVEYADAKA